MTERLDSADIQGIVASAYLHHRQSAYVLLKIDPAQRAKAKAWLGNLCGRIRTAQGKVDENSVNVALSRTGLRSLGLSEEILQSFSAPFNSGMRSDRRRTILSDPATSLQWGEDKSPVDVLLLLYAKDAGARDELVAEFTASARAAGVSLVKTVLSQIYDDFREHFGFVDGIGQPVPIGFVKPKRHVPQRDIVKNGEFLLGYENEYGIVDATPQLGPSGKLGRNGTYLVFRQTSQDVGGFQNFIAAAAKSNDVDPNLLAAKMVGRWTDGAPLVQAPDAPDPAVAAHRSNGTRTIDLANDFGFAEDPKGLRCPLGAHIRRANPRDGSLHTQSTTMAAKSARHRLLRRGRSYGARYDEQPLQERGLCFIALCADLERQFEFVQQTWLNNFAFNDLDEVDPLVSDAPADKNTFTIQAAPLRKRIRGMQTFVKLLGGAYFFVPSISALRWLAQ